MASDDMLEYDENEAVKFIRKYMPADKSELYSDDEILNVLDMIWDFYEAHGMLEISADAGSEPDPDRDAILDYVNKMLRKDKLAVVDTADVHWIVDGELEYEKTLDIL